MPTLSSKMTAYISIAVIIFGIMIPIFHRAMFPLNQYLWDGINAAAEEPFGSPFITARVIESTNKYANPCGVQYKVVFMRPYSVFMIPGRAIYACTLTSNAKEIIGIGSAGPASHKQ